MANRQENVDLCKAQVSALQLEIWLGLAWSSIIHSFIQRSPHQEIPIKKEEITA